MKGRSATLFVVLFIAFVLIYILNVAFPLMIDDMAYSFVYKSFPLRKVVSLEDIFESQYNHYFTWGGRSVVHVIAQLLILLPAFLHDFLNALVFVLLLYLLYRISNFGNEVRVSLFILLSLLMWFLQPGFASVYLWITGSANYLWGGIIIITFLYFYFAYYIRGKSEKGSILQAFLFLAAGVGAGWCNENMSLAIIAFIGVFFCFLKKENRIIPYWAILGFFGVVIGTIIMLKAPGNYVRLANEGLTRGLDVNEDFYFIKSLIFRIPKMLLLYAKRLLYIVIPYFILLHYFKKQNNIDPRKKQLIINSSYLFFISANVAFFAMVGAIYFPSRAFFGVIMLLIIAFCILFANFQLKSLLACKIYFVILFLALIYFPIDYYMFKYRKIVFMRDALKQRELLIEEGKKEGKKDFVFYDKIKVSRRLFFEDMNDDPQYWINKVYQEYYEVNSIKVYPAKK